MEPPTGVDTGPGVGGIGVRVGVAVGGDIGVGVAVGVASGGVAVRVGGGVAVGVDGSAAAGVDGDVGVRVGGGATVRVGVGAATSVRVVAGFGMEVAVAVGMAFGDWGIVAVSSGDGFPGRSISRTQPSKTRVAIIAPTTNNRARVNERPPSKSIES